MRRTGQAPFGFAWKEDGLCVVEPEARIRRLAFELYADLRNKAAVAKRLNALGHRTRRGSQWRDVTVARLFSCPSARGRYAVNRTVLSSAGERIEKPQDDWDFIEGPSIVSEELWKKVQAALASEAPPTPSNASHSHAFTGILFCICEARMNAATSSAKYVCAQCGNRISTSDLETAFLDEVTSFLRARRHAAAEIISGDPDAAAQRQLLSRTEEKARDIDAEISKAERLYMENRISVERFGKLHRPLEDERRAVQRELGKLKARLTRLEAKSSQDQGRNQFDPTEIHNRWPKMTAKTRYDFVHRFVHRIVVAADEIEFAYPFPSRDSSERTAKGQHSPGPTNRDLSSESAGDEPLYIRLPKPGQRCSRTGMTRSALNELILPTERNSYRPQVESKCLRKREGGKGTRLIVWQSLKEYLARSQ